MSTQQVTSESLDHLGIIAGICKDLNLSSIANSYLEKRNIHPKVTAGDAIVALILNGLGFVTRSLYMTSKFFEGKPVDRLLGNGISANDLNDDTLGRALDAIADFGAEKLFGTGWRSKWRQILNSISEVQIVKRISSARIRIQTKNDPRPEKGLNCWITSALFVLGKSSK